VRLRRFRISENITGFHLLLILVVGLVCYSPSFQVPFVFDDFDAVALNRDITGGRPLLDILLHGGARRIADVTFAVNYRLHGHQVAGYHLVNLVIHLSASLTFYLLCRAVSAVLPAADDNQLAGTLSVRHFVPLAASLLFVCHPIQTQAVTYIVQRHTSLAVLFYLLALLCYLKGRSLLQLSVSRLAVAGWWVGGLLAALLACFTKQIAFSLPLMILMFEVVLFRGRLLKYYLSMIVLGAVASAGLLLLPVLSGGAVADVLFDLRHALSETIYFPRASYLYTQLRVIVTYLRLLLLPVRQNLDYDYPLYHSLADVPVAASLLLHLSLAVAAVYCYCRSREDGDTSCCRRQFRLISFGICWFYIALLIESSFIPITDVIMEHRLYLPSAGFFVAVAAGMELLSLKFACRKRYLLVLLTVLCVLLTTATVMRNQLWGDDVAFWEDTARKSPRKGRVLGNLGNAYLNSGRREDALRMNVAAIRLDPTLERAWIRLGVLLQDIPAFRGRFVTGEEYLTPQGRPDFRWYAILNGIEYNNMGLACEYLNLPQDAMTWYWQAVQMSPDFDLAWLNLGLFASRHGRPDLVARARLKLGVINPGLASQLPVGR
jgi:tetratricopeptide (TPR) repeat protein